MARQEFKKLTTVVHAGTTPEVRSGAIMTPIFQTSTYVQSEPGVHKGWDYARAGNPTRDAYEEALATIENASYGLAFASGLAAIQAITQALLQPGDHVIVCDDVYGGTGRLFRKLFAKYNIQFEFLDMSQVENVRKALRPNTRMLWVETPTNPTLKVIQIDAMVKLGKQQQCIVVVDNTFASPFFQKPLQMGAHISVHSTTKYIGGHSDIIGGALMTNDKDLYEQIKFVQFAGGAVPSPMECFMLLRSIKTLGVRMRQHAENGQVVAEFLAKHPKIKAVYYPGLKTHPQYAIAKEQMQGFAGMLSFDMRGSYADVVTFIKRLKIFALAESLGGVESLVNHPEKMTHASVPEDLRKKLGIGPMLVRLSVGIEDPDDLIADLNQALA